MTRRGLEYACAVLVIGLLAGVAGGATTVVLHWVQHLTFHYTFGTLLDGVRASSPQRRALGPMIGCALAGAGWWVLRHRVDVPSLTSAIASAKPVPRITLALDAALQVLLVGSGASLGREGAPRQFAVAVGDLGISRLALTARDRHILLACAAGAGLGAVYSVPVGGALFATTILMRTWNLRVLGTALITSSLAVAVASAVTHDETTLVWPSSGGEGLTVVAVALAPLMLGVGMAFNALMKRAAPAQLMKSWLLIPAIGGAGLVIGICSLWYPELPGNGKSILTVSVNSGMTLSAAAILLVLKPLLTALFLRAGAVGGMLTPSLATGAAAGSACALAIETLFHNDLNVAVISLACAASVLAVTQRAPVWAAIFVWELGRPAWWMLAVFVATALTTYGLLLLAERYLPNRRNL